MPPLFTKLINPLNKKTSKCNIPNKPCFKTVTQVLLKKYNQPCQLPKPPRRTTLLLGSFAQCGRHPKESHWASEIADLTLSDNTGLMDKILHQPRMIIIPLFIRVLTIPGLWFFNWYLQYGRWWSSGVFRGVALLPLRMDASGGLNPHGHLAYPDVLRKGV